VSLEKALNAISHLGAKQSTRSSGLTKDLQTKHFLCWSGMTDAEHTISGSKKEEENSKITYTFHCFCCSMFLTFPSSNQYRGGAYGNWMTEDT